MHADETESELRFDAPGCHRDLPLTFQWRLEPNAIYYRRLPLASSLRHEEASAVLAEAEMASERNCWVSFSRRRAWYVERDLYYGDSFRYELILGAVADGVQAGLLEEDRAQPGSRGRQSRFRGTPLLHDLLSGFPIRSEPHQVIWLRDHRRRLVNYADTELTRQMREEVQAVNRVMSEIAVGINSSDVQKRGSYWEAGGTYFLPVAPRVRRVFNRGSFNKGGRLYGWWQGLPSQYRALMTLNGEGVLEPDFAQFHPQIIYALRDIPLVRDAYETGDFPREFGKRAFNIAVNAKSRGAVTAIANTLNVDRSIASKLLSAITAQHKDVADFFCSDAGVRLMAIDSSITLDAVQRCQRRGIAVLPVHDSLIVPESCADEAAKLMTTAFSTRFPKVRECLVRIKRTADASTQEAAKNKPLEQAKLPA
jgi:hypothetical protein